MEAFPLATAKMVATTCVGSNRDNTYSKCTEIPSGEAGRKHIPGQRIRKIVNGAVKRRLALVEQELESSLPVPAPRDALEVLALVVEKECAECRGYVATVIEPGISTWDPRTKADACR